MKNLMIKYRKDSRAVLEKVDDILVEELINKFAVKATDMVDNETNKLEDILFKYSNENDENIKSSTTTELLEYTLINLIGLEKATTSNQEILEFINIEKLNIVPTIEKRLLSMFIEQREDILNKILHEMKLNLGPYMMLKDNQLFKLELKKTSSIVTSKMLTLADIIILEKLGECVEVLEEVANQIMLQESSKVKTEKENTSVLEHQIENIKNIYDYKTLNKMAQSNGYILRNQTGSHGQYKHSNGTLVTIPQGRTIGKGLSCKIQKDILGGV